MSTTDLVVIALYIAATLGVGLWAARRASSSVDYFLGARNLPAWAVMLSIVATETSALTVISVPGIAAGGNLTFLQLAMGYLVGRIGVAVWLLPGYVDGRQQTAYERLESRFGPRARQALSLVFLVTRFLADGVRLFAGAIPLAMLTGWDVAWAIAAMGAVTVAYTLAGGLAAVVWTDVLQWLVYVAGGLAALVVAVQLAGGLPVAWDLAAAAGKLQVFDWRWSWSAPYTAAAALVGGALLSAASHGADHIIVQRLLATRSLRQARIALVGSGLLVIAQFALFLLVGTALWAAGQAPADVPPDQFFARFVIAQLPAGLAGLVVAGLLAASMSTVSSSIQALASSMTHDLYATWSGRHERAHLLAVGRAFSLLWGVLLTAGALGFLAWGSTRDTPVVVLALSIASVTYGALLGAVVLAAGASRIGGRHLVIGVSAALAVMLVVVFAGRLAVAWPALRPLASLAFPWYVPLGCAITVAAAWLVSRWPRQRAG